MADDWEPSEEETADIKRSMQDCDMGYFYTMLPDADGNLTWWDMECNMCKRVGTFEDRPFPHRFDCPMKDRVGD